MKEIKAFIPVRQIALVIEALRNSGLCDISSSNARCWNITVNHVQRLLTADDAVMQHYSVDLAELVVAEAKLELVCDDEVVDRLTELIATAAKAGRRTVGWVFVTDIGRAVDLSA